MNFPRLLWQNAYILIIEMVFIGTTIGKFNAGIPNHSIGDRTQSIIYSSVLGAIQSAHDNGTNASGPWETRNKTQFGEHYLGYSNNVFDSHTNYIKEVSKNKHYYMTNDFGNQGRKKRSVLHLYNMVLCATGCNPLSYKGYGCYCGFLGSGYAVDGIDRCCQIHDWCYDTAGCPMFLEYFIPYLWKCYSYHHPVCAIDHGAFGGPGSCAQRLCECDRQLAECLKMYPCPSGKAFCTSSPWRLLQNLFMN